MKLPAASPVVCEAGQTLLSAQYFFGARCPRAAALT